MNVQWKSDKKAFLHVCPVCGDDHYGRKNKLYCSVECKNRFNNDLAAERREQHTAVSSALIRNIEIIAEAMLYQVSAIAIVPYNVLVKKGFNPEAPAIRVKENDNIWLRYGDFCIQPMEELNQVKIIKIK